jgi:DNA ligase-1
MQFSDLAHYLEKLEKTSSRNEMTVILSEILRKTSRDEIGKVCYLLLGELLPAYRGIEFNIAEKIMIKIISRSYHRSDKEVAEIYKAKGDLGDVASVLAANSKFQTLPRHKGRQSLTRNDLRTNSKLSITDVYDRMLEVAQESGEGSQERKIEKLASLLSSLDPLSAKYVSRIPVGKLRLGFSDATLLDALSMMETGNKSARPQIERAYNVTADIGLIAEKIKKHGLNSLKKLEAQPGIPVRPSLAERIGSIEEIIQKAGPEVGVEQKLDGFRTQIHVLNVGGEKEVMLFSRNLENTTTMFPEIADAVKKLKVDSVILDGETIGYNPQTGKFSPFQETVQRKRKYGVEEMQEKIPLNTFVFDILYLDGKPLLELPFRERRQILEEVFKRSDPKSAIRLTPQKTTDQIKVIKDSLRESLAAGLEGLVVKNLKLPYEAGNRGFHWIKLKAASAALEELREGAKKGETQILDTIDCLLMGAYKGKGKRTAFGVGGFLLGVRGKDEKFYTISRLGTGLSDEQFREIKKRIDKIKSPSRPKEYVADKETFPDIWVKPSLVVEILADEITLSPRHTAGRKKTGERGYSLRFPRLVKFRDDKNPEDATTIKEIEEMYKKQ